MVSWILGILLGPEFGEMVVVRQSLVSGATDQSNMSFNNPKGSVVLMLSWILVRGTSYDASRICAAFDLPHDAMVKTECDTVCA